MECFRRYARNMWNVRFFWGSILNIPPPPPPLLSLIPSSPSPSSQILEFVGLREKLSQSLNFANTLVDMNLLETITTIHRYTPTPHTSHLTPYTGSPLTPHPSHLTPYTAGFHTEGGGALGFPPPQPEFPPPQKS